MRTVINAVIINENKEILLVKKRNAWILPGGKLEDGESSLVCLERELLEEIKAEPKQMIFYDIFKGKSPHKKDIVQARVYFTELLYENIQPSAEISDAKYVKDIENYNVSDLTTKIIDALRIDSYL